MGEGLPCGEGMARGGVRGQSPQVQTPACRARGCGQQLAVLRGPGPPGGGWTLGWRPLGVPSWPVVTAACPSVAASCPTTRHAVLQ